MPFASSAKETAILYDTGCTTLMTHSSKGMVGDVREVEPVSFSTALGSQNFSKVATFERTLFGLNGLPFTFRAVWHINEMLPFDVLGPEPLRKSHGLFYVDADSDTANTLPVLVMKSSLEKEKLMLARGANGLEWLSYAAPRVPRSLPSVFLATDDTDLQSAYNQNGLDLEQVATIEEVVIIDPVPAPSPRARVTFNADITDLSLPIADSDQKSRVTLYSNAGPTQLAADSAGVVDNAIYSLVG